MGRGGTETERIKYYRTMYIVVCFHFLYTSLEIEVEFTETTFSVTEDGTDPGVLVCLEILSGTVEGEELVVEIVNTGGNATGES